MAYFLICVRIINYFFTVPQLLRDGNDAFLAKNYSEAITHYSRAIEIEPNNAIFYSNRRFVKYRVSLRSAVLLFHV